MLEHPLGIKAGGLWAADRPDTAEAAKEAWMDQERLDERMRFLVNGAETRFSPDRFWKVARDARKGELGATPAERRENQDRILRPGVRPS